MILNSSGGQFIQLFVQSLMILFSWQYSSDFLIYPIGAFSLAATLLSLVFNTIRTKDSKFQGQNILSIISAISSIFFIYLALQQQSLEQIILSFGLLTIIIANITQMIISELQDSQIALGHIMVNSALIISSIISFVLFNNQINKSSQISTSTQEFATILRIFSGVAILSGISSLIFFNFLSKNAIKRLSKFQNFFQLLLLITMIWSISTSYTNFSQLNTTLSNTCPTQLKSIHQNALTTFGCSKYENNYECPATKMALMWEQDEGKTNSEKSNQIGCLNMDCCYKINSSMSSSTFDIIANMVSSLVIMSIAIVCSLSLSVVANPQKKITRIVLGGIVVTGIICIFYSASLDKTNYQPLIKASIKFKQFETTPLTSLSQRMLFQKHKFNHQSTDSAVCVKDDIVLSDYTPDEKHIEICDDKAQAITMHSQYQVLQKTTNQCNTNLQTCRDEKATLITEKATCEKGNSDKILKAKSEAIDNYNVILLDKVEEAKKQAMENCDKKISKLNDKLEEKAQEISQLKIDVDTSKDSCREQNKLEIKNIKNKYEIKLQEKDDLLNSKQSNYVAFNTNFEDLEKVVNDQTKLIKELSKKNDTCEKEKLELSSDILTCKATKETDIQKAKAQELEKCNTLILQKVEEANEKSLEACQNKLDNFQLKLDAKDIKITSLKKDVDDVKQSCNSDQDQAINKIRENYEIKIEAKDADYNKLNNNFIVLENLVKEQTTKIKTLVEKNDEQPKIKEVQDKCDKDKYELQREIDELKVELSIEKKKIKLYKDYQKSVEEIETLIKESKPKEVEKEKPVIIDYSSDFTKLKTKLTDLQKAIDEQKDETIKEKETQINSLKKDIEFYKKQRDKCDEKVIVLKSEYKKADEAREKKEKEKKKEEKNHPKKEEKKSEVQKPEIIKENCDAYESEIHELKDQVETYKNTIDSLTKFQKDFNTYREKETKILKDYAESQQKVIEQPKKEEEKKPEKVIVQSNDKNSKEILKNVDKLSNKIDSLDSKIGTNKDEIIEKQNDRITELANEIVKLQKRKPEVKETIVEKEKDNTKEINRLLGLIDTCKAEKEELKEEIHKGEKKIEKLQVKIDKDREDYEEQVEKCQITIKSIQEKPEKEVVVPDCSLYKQQVETLSKLNDHYEVENEVCKTEKENSNKIILELSSLKDKVAEFKSTIQTQSTAVKDKEKEIKTLESTISVLKKTCENKEKSDKITATKEELKAKLQDKEDELAKMEAQDKNEYLKCEQFTTQMKLLKREIEKLQKEEEKPVEKKEDKTTQKLLVNVDNLTLKLNDIEKSINDSKDLTIKNKEDKIIVLQEEVTEYKEKADKFEAQAKASEKSLKYCEEREQPIKTIIKEKEPEKQEPIIIKEEVKPEKEECEKVECDYSLYTSQIDTLTKQVTSYQNTIQKIEKIKEEVNKENDNEYDEKILNKIIALQSTITLLQDNLGKSDDGLVQKDTEITQLNNNIKFLKKDKEQCEKQIVEEKENTNKEKNKISKIEGEMNALQTTNKELKTEITNIESKITVLQADNSQCKADKSTLEKEKQEIKNDDECQAEKQQCEIEKGTLLNSKNTCDKQLGKMTKERDSFKKDYQNSIEKCEQEKSQLQISLKSASKSSSKTWIDKIDEEKAKTNKYKTKFTKLSTEKTDFKNKAKDLKKQLNECKKVKDTYISQVAAMQSNMNSLQLEVQDKTESLNDLLASKDAYFAQFTQASAKEQNCQKQLVNFTEQYQECNTQKNLYQKNLEDCQSQQASYEDELDECYMNYDYDLQQYDQDYYACNTERSALQAKVDQGCPPCQCESKSTRCPVCPDCLTQENIILQKPKAGSCPDGFNLEYKVEKVVSPDICIYPEDDFKKSLRKLGVIQDLLVKKNTAVFNVIDYSNENTISNAFIEIYSGKINCQDTDKTPFQSRLTNIAGQTTFSNFSQNNYYTAQIKKEGYQVTCKTFYIGNNNKESLYTVALLPTPETGYQIILEWNNPSLDLQLQGTFSYSEQDTCIVGFLNNECGEMIFSNPLKTENYAAQMITINQVAMSNYLFYAQSLKQSAKEFNSANPKIKVYSSESLYPIAEYMPPVLSEESMKNDNLVWLATCIDETSSQASMNQIGQFWQTNEEFISLPTSDICNQIAQE